MSRITAAWTVLMFTVGAVAWGQTFNVVNQVTSVDFFSTLDSTYTVTYEVELTSGSTLINVIPTLSPPACLGGGLASNLFSTSFRGEVGGSTTNLAIASWANGQTKQLSFNIHIYGDLIACDDAQAACGSDIFDFDLSFTHAGSVTPNVATDGSNLLTFNSVPSNALTIVGRHSIAALGTCNRYFQPTWTINLDEIPFQLGPNQRLLLGANWRWGTNAIDNVGTALGLFDYPLSQNRLFPLTDHLSDGSLTVMPESTFLTDSTGLVLGQTDARFQMAPLGGIVPASGTQLDCNAQGWNFFDITDQQLLNGEIVKDIVGTLGQNNKVQGITSREILYWRDGGLFIADVGGCSTAQAFYTAPSNFEFTQLHFRNDGFVEVQIAVPVAWTTGAATTLHNDYSVEWFYKNNQTYQKAAPFGGGATGQALVQTLSLPQGASANTFQIEARIRHIPTNSYVSVDSPKHELTYAGLGNPFFMNAEQPNADEFLDPGESFVFPSTITNVGSTTIGDFAINMGPTGNASAGVGTIVPAKMGNALVNGPATVHTSSIASSGSEVLDLQFFLIDAPACEDATFSMVFSYTDGNLSTSYTHFFNVPANCEFEPQTLSIGQNGWTDRDERSASGTCPDSNCVTKDPPDVTTHGWEFNNGVWTGSTESPSYFFTLTSPAIASPRNPRLHLKHTVNFPLGLAGGILEFRENFGQGWSNWQDLIIPIENEHNVSLYDSAVQVVSVDLSQRAIHGRRTFSSPVSPQNWTYDIPANLFDGTQVQFRFLFQLAAFTFINSGDWVIEEFDFIGELPNSDNLFGINTGTFSGCLSQIQLSPSVAGNYTYEFFSSLDAMLSNTPDLVTNDGIWSGFPSPPQTTDYYARVTDNVGNTVRVVSFQVAAGTTSLPELTFLLENWLAAVPNQSADLNNDDKVNTRDLVLQVNGGNCNP